MCVVGLDFQDCLPRLLASPASQRFVGARRPESGRLGVYLFPPFGLAPSQGWNDRCTEGVLRVASKARAPLQISDFAGQPSRTLPHPRPLWVLSDKRNSPHPELGHPVCPPLPLSPWVGHPLPTMEGTFSSPPVVFPGVAIDRTPGPTSVLFPSARPPITPCPLNVVRDTPAITIPGPGRLRSLRCKDVFLRTVLPIRRTPSRCRPECHRVLPSRSRRIAWRMSLVRGESPPAPITHSP